VKEIPHLRNYLTEIITLKLAANPQPATTSSTMISTLIPADPMHFDKSTQIFVGLRSMKVPDFCIRIFVGIDHYYFG
jgi:hypothetical protein